MVNFTKKMILSISAISKMEKLRDQELLSLPMDPITKAIFKITKQKDKVNMFQLNLNIKEVSRTTSSMEEDNKKDHTIPLKVNTPTE